MNKKAFELLSSLFQEIGWEQDFQEALQSECRNAYIHGLCDSAYDEWGDAHWHIQTLCVRIQVEELTQNNFLVV